MDTGHKYIKNNIHLTRYMGREIRDCIDKNRGQKIGRAGAN